MNNLHAVSDISGLLTAVREAGRALSGMGTENINALLLDLAGRAENSSAFILGENLKDLERMDPSDPRYDRLKLTPARIRDIAGDIRNVASLASPLGKILSRSIRPNGLKIEKITVPMGVIGIIYEARPNVTFDVFSLCIKSGNACILKGGSDAAFSNQAIIGIIRECLTDHGFPADAAVLLPPGRESTAALLQARDYVDLIIPRGSKSLIDFVRENAKLPVIETGAGIVHTYFDAEGDLDKGKQLIFNAKTRRVSVCNALDCLVLHASRLEDLPCLAAPLAEKQVIIYADPEAYRALQGHYPGELLKEATPESFGTEFLDYKMSVKTVDSLEAALLHIQKYSSKHSEAIVSENPQTLQDFLQRVDAAAVYANTSTAFTDGAQFGLGAEIGISTQKLHARGPMALEELCTYKWIVRGEGQIRP